MPKAIKSVVIKKTVVYSLTGILFAVLQTSAAPRLRTFGIVPDLMLALVVAVAFFENAQTAAVTAVVAGFVIDALGSVGFSFMPLFYLVTALVTYQAANFRLSHNFVGFAVAAVAASSARGVLSTLIIGFTSDSFPILAVVGKVLFPEIFGTFIWCVILYPLLSLIIRKTARNN